MRRLFPVTDQTTAAGDREWSLDDLADAYAYPERGLAAGGEGDTHGSPGPGAAEARSAGAGVWLRANMVSSLDGAAQHDGRSQPISSDADMRIFGTLRGLADAVVVGAETVRTEGYRPARARDAFAARRAAAGQGPAPAIAVVSASLNLDFSLPLFTEPLVPTLLLTGAAASPERVRAAERAGAEVVVAGDGPGVEPARAVHALAERGLVRLLTEGGPRMLGQFAAAGVLDELCLTVSPTMTVGDAQRIAGGPVLPDPTRFALDSVLEEAGFLFTRYRRL
ncbi:pyrimidine reductase family protein [Streptomyces sp. Tu 2975]|uniref:pyrimidine reductase family protein n=1 Tax=Streptomyces sp. Tu 2975 TaxID=2676871 RepID=UPI00135CD860|nr:pyrimidine reductase family protein [Streptomyces sp. Tu 2975]QIP84026.1 pyrimidine reductase family protein [Streptomyces sp. Tu 2975]